MSAVALTRAGGVARATQVVQSHRFAGIQRSRLLSAAVRALDELGYSDVSVADITARARVSRRTFYELFPDREACLAAALEDALDALARELEAAGVGRLGWRERVRSGLFVILSFFDREPVLARVCVVQALRGGPRVLERRERVLAGLAAVVDEGRRVGPRAERHTGLMAEGVVGAAFSIVYARLLRGSREPLVELLGELMEMIVLPYLGAVPARRERTRRAPSVPLRCGAGAASTRVEGVCDPLGGVSMRLTYRTAKALEGIAELGGRGSHPSNRQVAELAGIHDPGQVSKLLARLERLGLVVNGADGGHLRGEPNAWRLTGKGEQVTRSIRAHSVVEGSGG